MKKNISINISGIIFHIEEDGFETLKKYLDSINKYFSTFEDSSEILADIESRIAEIFLSKLNEEKQVITADDVNALVTTMGSVSDFKAAEEQPEPQAETTSGTYQDSSYESSGAPSYTPPKRLMRDQKRKILGGVCAGLANYFNIDALWIRLLFAIFTIAWGITLLVYAIMWVLVPGSYDLDEPIVGKKMYRDPERKVLGGVCGGLAAYLNIDIIAVRVIFIALIFAGGLGLFMYIVMWVILPEARSLTDKMQMQGEPVTLSNIESTLKKNQSERSPGEESTLTKILLFPFRLIGMILTGLGKILSPLVEVIRVMIGIMIVMLGMSLAFAVVVSAGALIGIFSTAALSVPWMAELNESSIPVDAFLRAFPGWTAFAAFLATIVPSVFIIMLGVSVIAKRIVFNAAAGWTMFVLFFVGVVMLSIGIPRIVYAFKEDAEYKVENVYKVNGKTAVLKINETGMDDYDAINLSLKGYNGTDFKLVQEFEAQGSSRAKAIENAKMVEYNVDFRDSVFVFDSNLKFKPDAIFRAQRLVMNLYIPYEFPFTMDEGMSRFINEWVRHEYLDGYTWKMTEKDGLVCVSCPEPTDEEKLSELRDFDEIEINGKFDVRISHGSSYNVELIGSESEKDKYTINREGETLVIDYDGQKEFDWKLKNLKVEEIRINITMPSIEKIEATGVGTIRFDNFHTDNLDIDLKGPIKLRADDLHATSVSVNLTGSSEAELDGTANSLEAQLEFASKLRAYNFQVVDAIIEAVGASSARVHVTGSLEMEERAASDIDYRGNPQVVNRD